MVNLHKHPQFTELSEDWQQYHDFYEGKKKVLNQKKYLVEHQIEMKGKEGLILRDIREKRTEYTNYIEPVISSYLSLFFKESPNIEEVLDIFEEEEIKNIDGNKKGLQTFIREDIATNYLLYGKPIIYIDAPDVDAKTQAEAKALGLRPYMQIINPLNAPDWQVGINGYDKFRFEYLKDEPRASLEEELKQAKHSKALYLRDGKVYIQIYKSEKTNKDGNEAVQWLKVGEERELKGLEELPVITTFKGESWIKDILPLSRRAFNIESNIDNINGNQGFQRLFVATDASAEQWKDVGESVIGKLPAGSTLLTVEPVDTTSQERRLAHTIMNIYKVAFNITRILPADSAAAEGDATLKERKQSLLDLIVSEIGTLEDIVNKAIQVYAKFKGVDIGERKVTFSRDVTDDDLDQVKATFLQHQSYLTKYPTLVKEYIKRMTQSMNLDKEEEILKEIDSQEAPNPIEEAKKERLQGQNNDRQGLRDRLNNTATNG